jgi:DNA-binding CsgD family transcriptional regulator/N-acetylneuraminic acid mutarotase
MTEEMVPLSEREMEIVRLVATGATNQQIARELVISVNTVKVHLRNIYGKMGVASRTEATMVAVREGWVEVPRTEVQGEDQALEEALGEPEEQPAARTLPWTEHRTPVAPAKRIGLLVAITLALFSLFLPQLLQGQTNGDEVDAIGAMFPTAPASSSVDRWHTRSQMPTPRTDLAVVAYNGLVYAIGGISNDGVTAKVEIYDPQADAWTTGHSKPTAVGFIQAAVLGDKIYVPGGIGNAVEPQKVLEVYDPAQDRWEQRAPLPVPIGAYGLAVLNDQLYLFGGRGEQGYVGTVYRYDLHTDRWEELKPMEQPRGLLSAAVLGDTIYVVGGYDGTSEFNLCEAYDPATDTWTPRAPMALRRGGLALVSVREHLYTIGGGMTSYLAFNERYDPRADVWTRITTPVGEEWRGLGAAFVNPYIYAVGGWSGSNLSVNEAYQALYQLALP